MSARMVPPSSPQTPRATSWKHRTNSASCLTCFHSACCRLSTDTAESFSDRGPAVVTTHDVVEDSLVQLRVSIRRQAEIRQLLAALGSRGAHKTEIQVEWVRWERMCL